MRPKRSTHPSSRVGAARPRRLAIEALEERALLSNTQIVTPSVSSQTVAPGGAVRFDVNYTTSPANPTLTGLGLRLHYNSSLLTYNSLSNVFATGRVDPGTSPAPVDDSSNYDGDPTTDKYVFVGWESSAANWPGGSLPQRLYTANFVATAGAAGSTTLRFSASSTAAGWVLSGTPATVRFAQVVGQSIFYNNSGFDGHTPAANAIDDNAIATDKVALRPGVRAAWQNYTSYSQGINGVMVDFDSAPDNMSQALFQFRVGNSDTPSTWTAPTASPTISVRLGAGTGGGDRVTLIWPDNAIQKTWLEVTVLPASASPYVFYFGNAPGETGNASNDTVVNTADFAATRIHAHTSPGPYGTPVSPYDHNRDGLVNSLDYNFVHSNYASAGNSLQLIKPIAGASRGAAAVALATVDGTAVSKAPLASDTAVAADAQPSAESLGLGPVDVSGLYAWVARSRQPETKPAVDPLDLGAGEPADWRLAMDSVLRQWPA